MRKKKKIVLIIIEKYKFHPSIKPMKSKNKGLSSSFSFKFATIMKLRNQLTAWILRKRLKEKIFAQVF